MKRIACLSAVIFLLGVGSASTASGPGFQGLKIGGGVMWNSDVASSLQSTGGGVHISADINPVGPFAFTPFYEISRRNGTNTTFAGGEFHYSFQLAEDGASVYTGPAIGIAHAGGKTKFHAAAVAGLKYPFTRSLGFFIQSKYVWAAGGLVNGVAGYTGLTLSMPM